MPNRLIVGVVGHGAREHSLAQAIRKSPLCREVWIAGINGGLVHAGFDSFDPAKAVSSLMPEDRPLGAMREIVREAVARNTDLVVIGPEEPLALGLANMLRDQGIAVFGPNQEAARIETSKAFACECMERWGVPTPAFEIFDNTITAFRSFRRHGFPTSQNPSVIKYDGLARGTGVAICRSAEDVQRALLRFLRKSGDKIVVQKFVRGKEASVQVVTDGKTFYTLRWAGDFKDLKGQMTGGMGGIAPLVLWQTRERELSRQVRDVFIRRVLDGLADMGTPFKGGCLYAGLILTEDGLLILEYNARFGNPELPTILRLMKSDILALLWACANGRLHEVPKPTWHNLNSVLVVMASAGYPSPKSEAGPMVPIHGLKEAMEVPGVVIDHAGTYWDGKQFWAKPASRVLAVSATAVSQSVAKDRVYRAVSLIKFEGEQYLPYVGKE